MEKMQNQKSLDAIARLIAFRVVTIRKLLIMSVLMWCVVFVRAQVLSPSVVASSGNSNVGADCMLNWTLGEIVGNTFTQATVILTQGFQQNFLEMQVNVKEIEKTTVDGFSIFPVPAQDILYLLINEPSKDDYLIEVINARGLKVLIFRSPANTITEKIDVSNLPTGVYMLRIIKPQGKLIKTIKFVKQ